MEDASRIAVNLSFQIFEDELFILFDKFFFNLEENCEFQLKKYLYVFTSFREQIAGILSIVKNIRI